MTENFILFEKLWRTKTPAISMLTSEQQIEYAEFSSISRIIEYTITHKEAERKFKQTLEVVGANHFDKKEEKSKMLFLQMRSMAAAVILILGAVLVFQLYLNKSSNIDSYEMKTLSLTERGENRPMEGFYLNKDYASVLAYSSVDDEAKFYKALSFVALKDYDQAEKLFMSITDVDMRYETYWNLAILYILKKDYQKAVSVIQQAILDENILDKKEFEKLKEKCHI